MDFSRKKGQMLIKLSEARSQGNVDLDALDVLEIINNSPKYFTTSSCSGRIAMLEITGIGRKKHSRFVFKTHEIPKVETIAKILLNNTYSADAWLLAEPPIFHVGSFDFSAAEELLSLGLSSSMGRSGFRSLERWFLVQLWGTGHLNCPVGTIKRNFIEKEDFAYFLSRQAQSALIHGKQQLKRLESILSRVL